MVRLMILIMAVLINMAVLQGQRISIEKQTQVATGTNGVALVRESSTLVGPADGTSPRVTVEGTGVTDAGFRIRTNSTNQWDFRVASGATTLDFVNTTPAIAASLTQAGVFNALSNISTDGDFLSNDHSSADTYLGGIYAGTPQIGTTIGNIFATSQADAPNVGFMSWTRADDSTGDHVGVDAVCVTNANDAKCWGANFIVSNNTVSITNSKLIGLEVDVQPVTEIPSSESAGIIINGFNLAIPGAGLHIGGSSGGTWANGIIMDGIDGAGLLPNGATTMDSLVNSGSGTFNDDAIVLSNTHAIRFAATTGNNAKILAKSDNNLYYIPPNAGLHVWRDTGDTTNRMVLNGATGDLTIGRSVLNGSVAHAGLGAAAVAVGQQIYCTDCTEASDPCTSGGTGTMAFRINGGAAKWKCL